MTRNAEHTNGALNLLSGCVGVKTRDRVLLIEETTANHFYCPQLGDELAARATALGARVSRIATDPTVRPMRFPQALIDSMAEADHAIFLNRIGDYSRFTPVPGHCSKTLCYALDAKMLNSPYCSVSHELMTELLRRLEQRLLVARRWRITCALGSDISGTFCWPSLSGEEDDEFTLSLFPVTTFKPVPCNTANGSVVLSRWLMPGGAAKVNPATVAFDGRVTVEVSDGILGEIHGPDESVRAVAGHYDRVASELNIRRDRVHSWHAGINPHTFYDRPVDDDLERWGAVSFASPRYLHFHTCGDTPPGEIAWSVFEPTVWIDDEVYWRGGDFVWLQREDNRSLVSEYPGAQCLLGRSADIGT